MPWYYAGPDAKPVGPIELNELQARRASGVITPETYVIEYLGAPSDAREWKRYRELFPIVPALPSPPPIPPPIVAPPPLPVAHHPLFPSAAAVPGSHVTHGVPPPLHTNPWCSWGFGLGLASMILLFITCGLGFFLSVLLALPAFVISIVGLVKTQHNRAQSGRNLAMGGLLLSGMVLILSIIILAVAIPAILKGRGLITTTEQSTTDSE